MNDDLLGELPAEAVELYLQAVESGSIPIVPPSPTPRPTPLPTTVSACSTSDC